MQCSERRKLAYPSRELPTSLEVVRAASQAGNGGAWALRSRTGAPIPPPRARRARATNEYRRLYSA